MGPIEWYIVIISTIGFFLSVLTYFGMHPRRIQHFAINFARFMQSRPSILVVVLFAIPGANLILLFLRIEQLSGILVGITGAMTGTLIAVLILFVIRATVGKVVLSKNIQLLAVLASRFNDINELPDKAKVVTASFGPPAQWLEVAFEAYGMQFVPVVVAKSEILEGLRRGVIDAVLVGDHPSAVLKGPIESGMVRLLPWTNQAIEAVTRAFPTATRQARLPANTYEKQPNYIQGYAPYS